MIGVVVLYGAGALSTWIDTLSAVGARYFGERRTAEAADDEGAHCIWKVTFARELEAGAEPPAPVAMGEPPPPEQAVSSVAATAAPMSLLSETSTWQTSLRKCMEPRACKNPGEASLL